MNLLCSNCQQWIINNSDKYCGYCGFQFVDIVVSSKTIILTTDDILQESLDKNHNLFNKKINFFPKSIEFGEVNPPKSPAQIIEFLNIDSIHKFIFKTFDNINENLSIEILNNNKIQVRLENIPSSGNRIKEYHDLGILIFDPINNNYVNIPVSFKRLTPKLIIDKSIINFKNVIKGNNFSNNITIYNKGDGLLSVLIMPSKFIKFKSALSHSLLPDEYKLIEFELLIQNDNDIPEGNFECMIILKTNEPEIRPFHFVQLKSFVTCE